MTLVSDIWHNIIFYYDSDLDSSTLLSLALSSRSLSKVVLPYLWRNLESLDPIISVINSFANLNEVFLSLSEDEESEDEDEEEYWTHSWVLWEPLPKSARERAKEYLFYIRCLSANLHCNYFRQTSLWPILFACLHCNGPLLPNLRHLNICIHEHPGPHLSGLAILLPSPLQVVKIRYADWSDDRQAAAVTVLNLLRNQECNLHTLEYIGPTFSAFHSTISKFQHLQSLLTVTRLPGLHRKERMASISFHKFLSSLPSLKNLDCKMEHFTEPPRVIQTPICHEILQVLRVSAAWGQGLNLFFTWHFPALSELAVQFSKPKNDSGRQWKLFFEQLASRCPKLRIIRVESHADDEFTFDDITPIFALAIECFYFSYGFHAISSSSLSCILEAWPKLNTLSYEGEEFSGETLKVLTLLSQHSEMRNFSLTLNLSPLASPLGLDNPSSLTGEKRSCIETIHLTAESVIPDEPGALGTIVKNLLIFFPRLSHFSGGGIGMFRKQTKLNEILQNVRKKMKQT